MGYTIFNTHFVIGLDKEKYRWYAFVYAQVSGFITQDIGFPNENPSWLRARKWFVLQKFVDWTGKIKAKSNYNETRVGFALNVASNVIRQNPIVMTLGK